MKEIVDALLFDEDLDPAEEQAFRRALAENQELAEACARWQRLRAHARSRLHSGMPERGLLVHHALVAGGQGDLLSADERHALEAARPAIEQALSEHEGLQLVVRRIQEDAAVFQSVWDEHSGLRPRAREDRPRASGRATRGLQSRRVWRGVLAVTMLCFLAMVTLLVRRDQHRVTIETGVQEVRNITFADGSNVRLMGASRLSYDGGNGEDFSRHVVLDGRAYFEVAPDEQVFTVATATALATVLGTSFGVDATDEVTEVVLASGRVAVAPVAAPDNMVVLGEGEMSRVARQALPSTPAPVNLAEELIWTGLFIFHSTPVEEIVRRMHEHYGIEIGVSPALGRQRVTGTFEQSQPPKEILRAVAATLGGVVQEAPGGGFTLNETD